MRKQLLVKYISGEVNKEEEAAVHRWLFADSCNMHYFAELKNIMIMQGLSGCDPASAKDLLKAESICGGKSANKRPFKKNFFIAALIIILLGFNLYLLFDKLTPKDIIKEEPRILLTDIPDGYKHTIYTNKGAKARLDLPDGSKVWLNADSRITFPDKFTGPTREVQLSGEAFFEVTADSARPMIVSTNKNFRIKVLGTKFNVKSYEDDAEATTTLISGTVELVDDTDGTSEVVLAKLNKEQSFVIKDHAKKGIVKESNLARETGWKNGYLIFESDPLREIIKQLERWHGCKFVVEDTSVLDYKYTAEFYSESIMQIMQMLKFISRIDYAIKDNTVYVWKRRN